MSALRDQLTEQGFAVGWAAVRRLPEGAAYALFDRIADRTWARRGSGVTRLEAHLARVRPDATPAEIRELSKAGMRSYLRYWCESFRLPTWDTARIVDHFKVEGEQQLTDALAAERGAVLVLPHMGNWDHAGAWGCLTHRPLTTVAERLKPESLYDRFVAYRETLGMEVLPLGGDGVIRTLSDRLRAGGMVCLLGDRDLSRSGVPVDFFGARTRMPQGPALLALLTGAPLLPVTLWFDGPDSRARIHAPVPVPVAGTRSEQVAAMTQSVAATFERGIAEHPSDWHMLQRLWLDELDDRGEPR